MGHYKIHQQLLKHKQEVESWFSKQRSGHAFPVYTSVDVRDSGHKVAVVDANIYPAGFNNICEMDREHAPELMKHYLNIHYGTQFKMIALLTEEHTNNPYYWENVRVLSEVIEKSGREVHLCFPRPLVESLHLTTSTGHGVLVNGLKQQNGKAFVGSDSAGYLVQPDLLISNNDFSFDYEEFLGGCKTPINPPRQLGWYQRKKSTHFEFYNQLAGELAKLIEVDPWLLQVETELFADFDMSSPESLQKLAGRVDVMLAKIKEKNQALHILEEPFVFVKNNAGTYGLGVTKVSSGKEVLEWNYKTRKKMKAAKGGREIEEVIIQEGIPSMVKDGDVTAEPVIYMIGCDVAGGFLRAHKEKSSSESLNSPGAVYVKLCTSDLQVNLEGKPLENVYGTVARLSSLAIGREAKSMNAEFQDFKFFSCSKS